MIVIFGRTVREKDRKRGRLLPADLLEGLRCWAKLSRTTRLGRVQCHGKCTV